MRFVSLVPAFLMMAFSAGCSGSGSSSNPGAPTPAPPTPPAGGGTSTAVTVSMPRGATFLTSTAYSPNPATIGVGTTVTWVNNDSDPHTTTSSNRVWDSSTLQPGASFSYTFQTAGSYPYLCLIHPNMVGTIVVQ